MLPNVLSVEGAANEDGATVAPSTAPPNEVWAEVETAIEPEQLTAAPVAPLTRGVSWMQSSSSFSSLSNAGPLIGDRRKPPVTSAEDVASEGQMVHFNLQVPGDESALANPTLVKQLCQAALLSIDQEHWKKRTVAEMFSSFYPMIIGVSFFFFF